MTAGTVDRLIATAPSWRQVARRLAHRAAAVVVGLGGLAVAAGGVEVALRLAYRAPAVERIYRSDASLAGYGLQPSSRADYRHGGRRLRITIDEDGHRTVPGAHPLDHRIYLVGDSQAFGWGLQDEETIAAGLQAQLGDHWQVVNLGVPGYGPFSYAEALEQLPEQAVRIVLQAEANDFQDSVLARSPLMSRCGYLMSRGWIGRWAPCWLLSSYALAAAADSAIQLAGSMPVPINYLPHSRAASRVLAYRIENLYERFRLTGGPMLVAAVPWDAAVVPSRLRDYVPRLATAERHVALPADVDLLDTFRRHPAPESLFLRGDSHLSPAGAALVAAALAEQVRRTAP
jgi:lysophospholipase L1-like esterase